MTAPSLGGQIREVRRGLGLSQAAFGDEVGVNRPSTVSDWERGVAIPSEAMLRKIEEVGGLEAGVLDQLARDAAQDAREDDLEAQSEAVAGMAEVWARIDEVSADASISQTAKLIRIEQILAAGRLALQYKETRLAERRTRAIGREADVAETRLRAVEREAELGDARLQVYAGEDALTGGLAEEDARRRAAAVSRAHGARAVARARRKPRASGE